LSGAPPSIDRRRLRVGLLGGSFDPIHKGHLAMAAAAERALRLDRIVFSPARRPWQKPTLDTPFEDRYAMVALALQHRPHWLPLALGAPDPAPTYTLDEVEDLTTRLPRAEVFLIMGADAFANLSTWYRCRQLLARCDFIVLARGTLRLEQLAAALPRGAVSRILPEGLELNGGHRMHWLAGFRSPLSSTGNRRRLAPAGIPAPVLGYVRRANLYPSASKPA